jgi:hypothetical protein
MEQGKTIDIAELRGLSERLFLRLEQSGVRQVGVDSPNYWTIFADDAFSLDTPPELVVGDVFDDLSTVRRDAGAPTDEAVIFWQTFHRLSGLMLFLAKADMQGELANAPAEGELA